MVSAAIKGVLRRLDSMKATSPVAVFVPWSGSATFQWLDASCKGAVEASRCAGEGPSDRTCAGDGDVGGLRSEVTCVR